jgi:hypothetical protein
MIVVIAAVGSPPAISYGAAMERRPIALLFAMAGAGGLDERASFGHE